MTDGPRVALVATVLNERTTLLTWLESIDRQTRQPDEVVIVDGGSDDGTWDMLEEWRAGDLSVRRLRASGANIARGRNAGVTATSSDIVAVTDAGTSADPDWLAQLVSAFDDSSIDVAAGFFAPAHGNRWERALAATTLPDVGEIDAHRFLPSSRSVAFRVRWFQAGVRYPEWLDYCEDVVWDLAMRRAGARFAFVPSASVEFRVRATPWKHARQYFRYARGDGKAGLFARRHALRYATYAGTLVIIRTLHRPIWWMMLSGCGLLYVRKPLVRLYRRDQVRGVAARESMVAAALIPPIRLLGDVSKMLGYALGLWWRVRTFGALGWRTSWQRVSPEGRLWRPGSLSRENRAPT